MLYTHALFHYLIRMIANRILLPLALSAAAVAAHSAEPSAAGTAREPTAVVERPAWPSHQEHMTGSTSTSETAAASEPAPVADKDSEKAYVLQVGAFREQAVAVRAAEATGMEELKIMATRRDGQDWYVLVLGSYETREDARAAGEAYLDAHPKGSVWVRAAVDLQR